MEDRTINFIFALITGTSVYQKNGCFDIWDFRPGVDFFVTHFVNSWPGMSSMKITKAGFVPFAYYSKNSQYKKGGDNL